MSHIFIAAAHNGPEAAAFHYTFTFGCSCKMAAKLPSEEWPTPVKNPIKQIFD